MRRNDNELGSIFIRPWPPGWSFCDVYVRPIAVNGLKQIVVKTTMVLWQQTLKITNKAMENCLSRQSPKPIHMWKWKRQQYFCSSILTISRTTSASTKRISQQRQLWNEMLRSTDRYKTIVAYRQITQTRSPFAEHLWQNFSSLQNSVLCIYKFQFWLWRIVRKNLLKKSMAVLVAVSFQRRRRLQFHFTATLQCAVSKWLLAFSVNVCSFKVYLYRHPVVRRAVKRGIRKGNWSSRRQRTKVRMIILSKRNLNQPPLSLCLLGKRIHALPKLIALFLPYAYIVLLLS